MPAHGGKLGPLSNSFKGSLAASGGYLGPSGV